jgi:hypothetical protein
MGGIIADRRSFKIGPADYDEDAYLFEDLRSLASLNP